MSENLIEQHLKTLSLHRINETYRIEAENAAKAKIGYQDYLQRLLEIEIISKIERSINRKMQIAGFPQLKKLEEFDFSYQPMINEKLIRELASLNFLEEAKNILLLALRVLVKLILLSLVLKLSRKERGSCFLLPKN